MEDDKDKTADSAAEQDSSAKTTEETDVDYDKELEESIEKFEQAEKNREGYQKRKAVKVEEDDAETTGTIQDQVAAAIAKELPKIVPQLQSTLAQDSVEAMLNELSQGNASKKKLIQFHFEKSVGMNGTIRERMENAALIADKKAIQKRQAEMATALKNRSGLGASGLGSSTEGQDVKDNILTADQLKDLKARGWPDKKIEAFKKNLRR